MRKKLYSTISLILIVAFILPVLSSCSSPASDTGADTTTDPDTTEQGAEDVISPEDIVYEQEEIPSVYISTANNFQVTSKTEYTKCTVRFALNERYSQYSSTYTDADGGGAQIRCRGNMSYRLEDMKAKNKYSYKIKLDEKANVLGMGKSKHWILVNSWRDPGYQRNKLSYDFSAMLGLDHVDTQWVSVYYNGEYRGMYLLCETIRVDDDRVEMFNWEEFAEDVAEEYAADHGFDEAKAQALSDQMEKNLAWISTQAFSFDYNSQKVSLDLSDYFDPDNLDFTSGYLIESCQGAIGSETVNWYTKNKVPISVDSPSRLTNPNMLNYVKTLIQDFEDALFSPTFYNDKGKHYSEYVDVDSMVDYWMVWNYFCNYEFSLRSLFFYIKDGKIVWGPCWDFDGTMGSIMTLSEKLARPDYWMIDRNNAWWRQIFGDPWFTSLCQERWYEMRELTDVFVQTYDIYYNYIEDEAKRGYAYDGERYINVNQPQANNGHSFNPEQDYNHIKNWLKERTQWLDENFSKIDPNIDGGGYIRSEKIFFDVKQNGTKLKKDELTVYGVNADHLLDASSTAPLSITVSTTHSAVVNVGAYLNGSTDLGIKGMSSSVSATYTIDTSMLNMEDGALNVIYLIAYRADKTVRSISSIYIRVSDTPNPEADECVVEFGDEAVIVKKGEKVTVPEAPYTREGYVFCGWTASYRSNTLYQPGDTFSVLMDTSLYMRFKPIDMCSEFVLDEYTLK